MPIRFHSALRPMLGLSLLGLIAMTSMSVSAATCIWNAASPSPWNLPAHWTGCASGSGTPVGTPGPMDRAVFPAGTGKALIVSQFTTIAELEMAPGTELGVEETQLDLRQLTITSTVLLNGATLSGALPPPGGNPPLLSLQLPVGSTLSLNGTNTLRRAFVTNAGVAIFNGGAGVRLNLDLNGNYTNAATGTTTILGSYVFGYTTSGTIDNQGLWINQGPGLIALERSGASGGAFNSSGSFDIRNATFKRLAVSSGFQSGFANSAITLLDGTFEAGGSELATNKSLSGNGSIVGAFRLQGGLLDLYASTADAIGALTVTGSAIFSNCEMLLDVDGPSLAQHDRLSISGAAQYAILSPRIRINHGYSPTIDTTIPIATHGSLSAASGPLLNRVLSDFPLSLMLRTAPTQLDLRVVPTLTIADGEVIEGNAGTQAMSFAVTLSAPTTEVVSFSWTTSPGTAVTVPVPPVPADYNNALGSVSFAPGSTAQQIQVTTRGDTEVEADEAFSLITDNSLATSTLKNASFGNDRKFFDTAEGLIRDDDSVVGTRYLLIGKSSNQATPTGQISFVRRYTTTGVAVDSWATLMPNVFGAVATGFCRAPDGHVLSTRFNVSQGVVLMSASGTVLDGDFGGLIGSDESCAFDQQGNVWVGEAIPSAATTAPLRYIAADGRLLETLDIPVGERGTDWIELDANQCTLYYTSEDSDVRRYDVCTRQPMSHFATGLEAPCYAVRQLPNREVMVTCRNRIYRYDMNGGFVREYTKESLGETDVNGLYAIHLDPDGETFWAGGVISGRVVRARIDDGTVVTSFNSGSGGVNGLLIQDEYVAGISLVLFKDGFEP